MAINEVLADIQQKINVPKNQHNKFGGYNYRSLEDILVALKPLLAAHKAAVTIDDEVVMVGSRYYVKATATLVCGDDRLSCVGWAREADERKGMDSSQVTGSTSSYARKYAANGLFAIDDNKDADHTNTHGKDQPKDQKKAAPKPDAKKAPPPDNAATKEQQEKLVELGAAAIDMTPAEVRDLAAYYRKGERLSKDEAQDLIDNFDERLKSFIESRTEGGE